MKESSATIKLTKSEIEWNILALVIAEKSSEMHDRFGNAKTFKKLREDLIKIKNDIIEGEKKIETRNKTEEKIRTGPKTCESCID
tara:strand:+ start:374 stop:628 length:255 start_codon:yes stop_codon:yes gene_type:complete